MKIYNCCITNHKSMYFKHKDTVYMFYIPICAVSIVRLWYTQRIICLSSEIFFFCNKWDYMTNQFKDELQAKKKWLHRKRICTTKKKVYDTRII